MGEITNMIGVLLRSSIMMVRNVYGALLCCSTPAMAIINGVEADTDAFQSYVSIRAISPFRHDGAEINAAAASDCPELELTAAHCCRLMKMS